MEEGTFEEDHQPCCKSTGTERAELPLYESDLLQVLWRPTPENGRTGRQGLVDMRELQQAWQNRLQRDSGPG